MANEAVNNWIRQASGKTPAPVATEAPPAPKVPTANAGNGSGQTGVFTPKQNFNVWLRSQSKGRRY